MNTPQSALRMGKTEWLLLFLLSLVWGGSYFFSAIAVRELPTLTIVATRLIFGVVMLWIVLAVTGQRLPRGIDVWFSFLAMGVFNAALPFMLIVWGQHHIASGLAAILNATTPLMTVVVAHLFTDDEKITPGKALGLVFGICGVIVMLGVHLLAGLGSALLAQLACLGAALSYAAASIFGRRFRRMGIAPMVSATGQISASVVFMVPLALVVDQPWTLPMPSAPALGALVALGLFSTALAYIIYFRILSVAGATNLALVTFLIPLSAILLGVLLLGEHLDARHFAGMALIGAGLAAIDGRLAATLASRFGRRS